MARQLSEPTPSCQRLGLQHENVMMITRKKVPSFFNFKNTDRNESHVDIKADLN
jgi:hypothetical protein